MKAERVGVAEEEEDKDVESSFFASAALPQTSSASCSTFFVAP